MAPSYTVVVTPADPQFDVVGKRILDKVRTFGFTQVQECRASKLYFIEGNLTTAALQQMSSALLTDSVTETVGSPDPSDFHHTIDVGLLPGVTDTEGENLLKACGRLGIEGVTRASRGQRYHFKCEQPLSSDQLRSFAHQVLCNEVVETFTVDEPLRAPFVDHLERAPEPEVIPLRELTGERLVELSKDLKLALDEAEMGALREHFRELDREPTRCELETFAQTWSEHCVHKTFRARIDYVEEGKKRELDGLLPILRETTEQMNLDWIVSAFVDNAGIVKFHPDWNVAIKAETHNHPSALEPFGGANTGVGGVIRDILGVSARPFCNWDVLCFGPLDAEAPEGSLPPGQVMKGVVDGIADYGNKMGIPTVAGAVLFHQGYLANPLVYCGCLGVLSSEERPCRVGEGDLIVLLGGKTGRDGLGGATFSSLEMDTTTAVECGTAVQIGHPIAEKVVGDLLLEARSQNLYNAVTDCGAGGLASAVGEMGEETGAVVHLDRVPTKYPGLTPRELWLSEAQERMVCAVSPDKWPELQKLARGYDTVCVEIGNFGNAGRLQLLYSGRSFCDLEMDILHNGLPRHSLTARWTPPKIEDISVSPDPGEALLKLLSDPNICSREPILRRYDHEVQGGTAVKPVNLYSGPADGVALVPIELQGLEDPPAVVLGCGVNPWLTELDPRLGTLFAIDEAIRNVVAVGADPERISLLDNFSWGNPKREDRLGKLCRSVLACAEGSKLYQAPFVSGKDSLNNEFLEQDGSRRAIPGTILISAVGQLPQVSRRVTTGWKEEGNVIVLLGENSTALGGSHYLRLFGGSSSRLPTLPKNVPALYKAYYRAVQAGLVESCHDPSDGGLAVALAESCLAGNLGATVAVEPESLFSEAPGRLLVEVSQENLKAFQECLNGFECAPIGHVCSEMTLKVNDQIALSNAQLEQCFHGDQFQALGGLRAKQAFTDAGPISTVPAKIGSKLKVAVLRAPGINREEDAALAVRQAGGEPVYLNPGQDRDLRFQDFALVVLPGGFSFGDDLGAGRLWALELKRVEEALRDFVERGGALLGTCNGFQALLRSSLLLAPGERASLTYNSSDHFECRWTDLTIDKNSPCVFTHGLEGTIRCPVAHGEGRFVAPEAALKKFEEQGRVPLRYRSPDYPHNPNGSHGDVAALCSTDGRVMGLMPHPENNVLPWQSDRREPGPLSGLALFTNALRNLR